MTDSTLTPAPNDPPMTLTPLLTEQGFAVCGKFSSDLADLCNAASLAGMTPNMIGGQLWNMSWMIGSGVKDDIDAIPAPAPPVAPDPAPAPAPVTAAPLPSGSTATLTVGALTVPTVDGQVLGLVAADGFGATYSVELTYSAQNGFTYTIGSYWPGITLYGLAGDVLRLTVTDTTVEASISQNNGATWTAFHTFQRTEASQLSAHVTSTTYAAAGSLVVTP